MFFTTKKKKYWINGQPRCYYCNSGLVCKKPRLGGFIIIFNPGLKSSSPLTGDPNPAPMAAAPSAGHPYHTWSWYCPITRRIDIPITTVNPATFDPDMPARWCNRSSFNRCNGTDPYFYLCGSDKRERHKARKKHCYFTSNVFHTIHFWV